MFAAAQYLIVGTGQDKYTLGLGPHLPWLWLVHT